MAQIRKQKKKYQRGEIEIIGFFRGQKKEKGRRKKKGLKKAVKSYMVHLSVCQGLQCI